MKVQPRSAVYFVQSPLQLLGAIEANEMFRPDRSVLFMRTGKYYRADSQMEGLLDRYSGFSEIRPLFIRGKVEFWKFLKLVFFILFFSKRSNIFLGDVRSKAISLILKYADRSRIWLLDDGLASVSRSEAFNIFTFFDIKPQFGGEVVIHSFGALKRILTNVVPSCEPSSCFLGSPIVERGVLPDSHYFDFMRFIYSNLSRESKRVRYFMHRAESKDKVGELEIIGFEVIFSENVFELDFLSGAFLGCDICSFYSTALITAKRIDDDVSCLSFRIPDHLISKEFLASVVQAYAALSYEGVTMINLEG